MKTWIGKCEELPSYEFVIIERSERSYECRIRYPKWDKSTDVFTFSSLSSVRGHLKREYGKVSLKLNKAHERHV